MADVLPALTTKVAPVDLRRISTGMLSQRSSGLLSSAHSSGKLSTLAEDELSPGDRRGSRRKPSSLHITAAGGEEGAAAAPPPVVGPTPAAGSTAASVFEETAPVQMLTFHDSMLGSMTPLASPQVVTSVPHTPEERAWRGVGNISSSTREAALETSIPDFPDDQFSCMEKQVILEVNRARSDPAGCVQRIRAEHVMEGPYLPGKPLDDTVRYAEALQETQQERDAVYEAAREKRQAKWLQRQEELLHEVNQQGHTRKRGRKANSAKARTSPRDGYGGAARSGGRSPRDKRDSKADVPSNEETPEEILEREQQAMEATERRLEEEHYAARDESVRTINGVTEAILWAERALACLGRQSPVDCVAYSRGLSLCSRDHPLLKKQRKPKGGAVNDASLEIRLARYGVGVSTPQEIVYLGLHSARDLVYRVLLQQCEEVAARSSTSSGTFSLDDTNGDIPLLLAPTYRAIGVGWGRRAKGPKKDGVCVMTLSERFLENKTIRLRHHHALETLIRDLDSNHNTFDTTQVAVFPVPGVSGLITVVSPEEHPVVTTSRHVRVVLATPQDVVVVASLNTATTTPDIPATGRPVTAPLPLPPPPSATSPFPSRTQSPGLSALAPGSNMLLQNNVFVQHSEDVTIDVILPKPGKHKLMCFAKKYGSQAYTPVCHIWLHATFRDALFGRSLEFPETFTACSDLRCFIVTPTVNPLLATRDHDFEIRVIVDREGQVRQMEEDCMHTYRRQLAKQQVAYRVEMDNIERQSKEIEQAHILAMQTIENEKHTAEREKRHAPRRAADNRKSPAPLSKRGRKMSMHAGAVVEESNKVLSDRETAEIAKLEQRRAVLQERRAVADRSSQEQQEWAAVRLTKDRKLASRHRSKPVEVVLVNSHFRHTMHLVPDAPNTFAVRGLRLRPGNAVLFVDDITILKWQVE